MKFVQLLPLAALSSAFVIPDEAILNELAAQTDSRKSSVPEHPLDDLKDVVNDLVDGTRDEFESVEFGLRHRFNEAKTSLDDAFDKVFDAGDDVLDKIHDAVFDAESWLSSGFSPSPPPHGEHPPPPPPPPHDGPPHDGPPHRGPHEKPPHKGKPHHPPHHKPNQTVYELIANSKYTTKLAKLINEDPELVKVLNGTAANYTVFAPTDKAFEKIPKHGKKPSEEFIKKVLLYHVSPDFYPAGRVLKTYTIPTLYKEPELGDDYPQRLSVNVGLKGLTLDFYSRIVAIDIFGTNGVIHGIDTVLLPPPKTVDIISLLPGEFSTLALGLEKTGLLDALNTSDHTTGGTFFAPSNWAFKKLGPRINAFLFSTYGQKYLKALLEYHVVPDQTLYSDAYYRPSEDDEEHSKGYFHVDLPTLLEDKTLSVDIGSHGPFTEIKINGFSRVAVQNGVAKDGVIHVVSNVLIPPKTAGSQNFWNGEHMSVEEFKDRLAPFVESGTEPEELGWGEL
ncbi:Fasciclin domain-containing protein [Macrophomina phaseolina]|uniref:Fasciclin domain-containing protein n=1 Tax=Macrophomina phaseolina TaxID=35725 RepID=A0ABQ8GUI9_9PEZI|nr:Fasciclin domain-containing protein [Macrophomina phaseolina]